MLLLPTSTLPDYTQTVVLDGVSYDLRLQWNTREEAWYGYLGPTGLPFLIKVKIVNGWDLLRPFKYIEGIPKGELYLIDVVASWGRPTRSEVIQLGRFNLVYVTKEESDAV
jgi:hypothetical protein